MPLEAYKRRHSPECLAEIARRVAAGQMKQPKNLEQYRACDCAWWVRGKTDYGELIPRHSLKAYTFEAAQAALKKLNRPPAEPASAPVGAGARVALEDAKKHWLAEVKLAGGESSTLEVYELAARKLIAFMDRAGLRFVQDVTPVHLNQMRTEWDGLAHNTHSTYRTNIGCFLNFCVRMDWIASNPMKKTRRMKRRHATAASTGEDDGNATMPLDEEGDANYQKVCASLIPYLRNEIARGVAARRRRRLLARRPENCLALVHLMYETGLRVSDATFFDPSKLETDAHGGIYATRQIKTKGMVTVFLPSWLVEEIHSLPKLDPAGRYPFYDGSGDWRMFIRNNIRPILAEVGELIGISGSLRPHRLRDSFAVNRLNEGMTMDELRILLGHANVAMTERYYAPFVKSRAQSLRARLHATREASRSGKLVAINRAG